MIARGLGRGQYRGVIVTAGLGLVAALVPPAPAPVPPQLVGGPDALPTLFLSEDEIRRQNDLIIMTVIAAVTRGMLE